MLRFVLNQRHVHINQFPYSLIILYIHLTNIFSSLVLFCAHLLCSAFIILNDDSLFPPKDVDGSYMHKIDLGSKADSLTQHIQFLRALFEAVRIFPCLLQLHSNIILNRFHYLICDNCISMETNPNRKYFDSLLNVLSCFFLRDLYMFSLNLTVCEILVQTLGSLWRTLPMVLLTFINFTLICHCL